MTRRVAALATLGVFVALDGCSRAPALPAVPPGPLTVSLFYTSNVEGEIEPCG